MCTYKDMLLAQLKKTSRYMSLNVGAIGLRIECLQLGSKQAVAQMRGTYEDLPPFTRGIYETREGSLEIVNVTPVPQNDISGTEPC